MGSIKKHHKEFIKNKNLILKPHQDIEARNIIHLLKKLTRLH